MKHLLVWIFLVPMVLSALSFNAIANLPMPGISHCSIHWGDYDNNGHQDLLITGNTNDGFISYVYKNNGNNTFSLQQQIILTGVCQSKGVWGDFDNDGYLDIVISGASSTDLRTTVTKIYRNNRQGGFEETDILLPGLRNNVVKWVDFNNNGWLDLFLAGEGSTGAVAVLYKNNQGENFTLLEEFQFPGAISGDAAFIDFTKNGYPDLVLCGQNFANVYFNDNGRGFILQNNINLPNIRDASVNWGDYDNDGYPDLLITGLVGTVFISRVYKNINGASLEWQQNIVLPGLRRGQSLWADMNNNGLLDIVLNGEGSNGLLTTVYLNSGANVFTEAQGLNLEGVRYSSIAVTDINNNGKLDLTIAGLTSDAAIPRSIKIYLNQINRINTRPEPPTELNVATDGSNVRLMWNAGADNNTPVNGLNYNVVLRRSGGEGFLIAPNSNLNNGFRRINSIGNAGYNRFRIFEDIEVGPYQWAVQTIDSSGAGSVFSEWYNFDSMPKPENVRIIRRDIRNILIWDRVDEADYYRIYGSANPESREWTFLQQVTETEYQIDFEYDRYFFKVTAVME